MPEHGVDVSHYNGDNTLTLAKPYIDFLYAKCTEGTNVYDQKYQDNRNQARAIALPVGAYHFAHPSSSPSVSAQEFINFAGRQPGDLPYMVDVEASDGMSPSYVANWLMEFMRYVPKCVIYTGSWFWVPNVSALPGFATHPLWLGPWTSAPKPWSYVTIGQTYSKNIPGIGSTDYDTMVHGTVADLIRYADGTSPQPAPQPQPSIANDGDMPVVIHADGRSAAYLLPDGTRTGPMGSSQWTAINHVAKQGGAKVVKVSTSDFDAFLRHK